MEPNPWYFWGLILCGFLGHFLMAHIFIQTGLRFLFTSWSIYFQKRLTSVFWRTVSCVITSNTLQQFSRGLEWHKLTLALFFPLAWWQTGPMNNGAVRNMGKQILNDQHLYHRSEALTDQLLTFERLSYWFVFAWKALFRWSWSNFLA